MPIQPPVPGQETLWGELLNAVLASLQAQITALSDIVQGAKQVATLSVNAESSTTAIASWTPPPAGDPPFSYLVSWSAGSDVHSSLYDISDVPLTISGLTADTTYTFTVTSNYQGVLGQSRTQLFSTPAIGYTLAIPTPMIGGYWLSYGSPRLSSIPAQVNTVFLGTAVPVGGSEGGSANLFYYQENQTTQQLVDDISLLRSRGTIILLTVGTWGEYITLDTEERVTEFVNSIISIVDDLGGIDGIHLTPYYDGGDWLIDPAMYVSAATQLRAHYNGDFLISMAAQPWRVGQAFDDDQDLAAALLTDNVLDLVALSFFDLWEAAPSTPQAVRLGNIADELENWVTIVTNPSLLSLGFRIVGPSGDTVSLESSESSWSDNLDAYPTLRGAFIYNLGLDQGVGWEWVNTFAALINPPDTVPMTSALFDPFTSKNLTLWTYGGSSDAASGVLTIPVDNGTSSITSVGWYNLDSLFIKLNGLTATPVADESIVLKLENPVDPTNNYLLISIKQHHTGSPQLYYDYKRNGTGTNGVFTYVIASYPYIGL